jgi:hypothetical protein
MLLLSFGWLPAAVQAQPAVLIEAGSQWRYNDAGKDLGTAWREPGFDDKGWSSGKAPLGYGADALKTQLSFGGDPNRKYTTYYFRTTFSVADPTVLPTMLMKIRYDDGFIAYLNGHEIARAGFSTQRDIGFATFADDHVDKGQRLLFETFNLTNQRSAFIAGKNVLAIEVHQHTLDSSDVVLDVSLEPATNRTAPQIVMGPALGQLRDTSAHVLAAGDVPAMAVVQYGPTPTFGSEQRIRTEAVVHDLILGGLKPGATYYYRVGLITAPDQTPAWSDTRSFTTDAGPDSAFRFGVWSGGPGAGDMKQLAQAFEKLSAGPAPRLAVALGGQSGVTESSDVLGVYTQYHSALKPLAGSVALYSSLPSDTAPGCDSCLSAFQNYLPNPTVNDGRYYSFNYGSAHFVVLDSSERGGAPERAGLSAEQWAWLADDLAAQTQPYSFVFMDRSPFEASGSNAFTPAQRDALHQLFKSAKVTAVFASAGAFATQDHDGLPYVSVGSLAGAAGQMVYVDVQPAEVKLIAVGSADGAAPQERTLASRPGVAVIAPAATPAPSAANPPPPAAPASGPTMAMVVLVFVIGLVGGGGAAWAYWRRTQW